MLPAIRIDVQITTIEEELRIGLLNLVLEKVDDILSYPCTNPDQDSTWLTSRLWHYNFLNYESEYTDQLKKFIRKSYESYCNALGIKPEKIVYCQCWANRVLNDGRPITLHNHAESHGGAPEYYSYISGHLSLQAIETTTDYKSPFTREFIQIPNKNGEMTLFPSFVDHKTSKNLSDVPRISIAFDLTTEEVYNILKNKNYVPL